LTITPDQLRRVGIIAVVRAPSAESAIAGAQFLVSPGVSRSVAQSMTHTGLTTMIGALTPSEVMAAVDLRADVVKIFPAGIAGPKLIASLRGPFPDVAMMPTGGVSTANLADWLATGVVAVGAGSELASGSDLGAGRFELIQRRAEEMSTRYHELRRAEVSA
jgi:2-dehydro-3-deoxyphosphogluconate aldolase/(4S)-4-hydroxy-2-oxoglutarate aldolase